jgi:hypothetical protein
MIHQTHCAGYYSADTKFWNGVQIEGDNKIWQRNASDALGQWIDKGVASFSWDVFQVHSGSGQRPEILSVVEKLRNQAGASDPRSTFSGESVSHLRKRLSTCSQTAGDRVK